MTEIQCTCTKCGETQPLTEFHRKRAARNTQCRTCVNADKVKRYHRTYDPTKLDFRGSPHVDRPDMSLRYHLVDPVNEELVATAATKDEAREAALKYHYRRRVRIKFVEIYDEETQEVYHLTCPTKRYTEGVMRGPCKPVPPDESLRRMRGPDKVPRGPRKSVSANMQSEGNNATTIDNSSDSVSTVPDAAPGVR